MCVRSTDLNTEDYDPQEQNKKVKEILILSQSILKDEWNKIKRFE